MCYVLANDVAQSETLKYLFLLFSDDTVLPLDGEPSIHLLMNTADWFHEEYVFNTEVHIIFLSWTGD
jgi:hypothetical protein